MVNIEFQVNHYLFEGFKTELHRTIMRIGSDTDWSSLAQPDPNAQSRIAELEDQIKSLNNSLFEVTKLGALQCVS